MDCLERKMDSLHAELSQYKNRCIAMEAQNATLVAQVKKLQAQLAVNGGGVAQQAKPAKVVTVMVRKSKLVLAGKC